jgi:hypothetical protein
MISLKDYYHNLLYTIINTNITFSIYKKLGQVEQEFIKSGGK